MVLGQDFCSERLALSSGRQAIKLCRIAADGWTEQHHGARGIARRRRHHVCSGFSGDAHAYCRRERARKSSRAVITVVRFAAASFCPQARAVVRGTLPSELPPTAACRLARPNLHSSVLSLLPRYVLARRVRARCAVFFTTTRNEDPRWSIFLLPALLPCRKRWNASAQSAA